MSVQDVRGDGIAHPSDLMAVAGTPWRVGRYGVIAAVLFFVVLLGWASVAPLDASAIGEGRVSVVGNRQTIQHREGGQVDTLAASEGKKVEKGEVLVELDTKDIAAEERALTDTVLNLEAQRARLQAEITGKAIRWPPLFASLSRQERAIAEQAKELQLRQYRSGQGAKAAGRSIYSARAGEVTDNRAGLAAQADAARDQRKLLEEQLQSYESIADRGFISKNRIREIERAIADLKGQEASYRARMSASNYEIAQSRSQSVQVERASIEDSAGQLNEVQAQLGRYWPSLRALRTRIENARVRAPVSGTIVGLRIFTVGGVVQPGEPLMDIVPDKAGLVVTARFRPEDIDGVAAGKAAELKFLSLRDRGAPILLGEVRTVSADALKDDGGESFFNAEIAVPQDQLALLDSYGSSDSTLRPGAPVQVIVPLRSRTALQYIFDPLFETMRLSLRRN